MNANTIKKYTLINIRISTILISVCYIYTIVNDAGIYSNLSSIIIYTVPILLIFIILNLLTLVFTIIKTKKTNK